MSDSNPLNIDAVITAMQQNAHPQVLIDAMKIVAKYRGLSEARLKEFRVDELQSDSLCLTSMNFAISTIAECLSADASMAAADVKYKNAYVKLDHKSQNPKATVSDLDVAAELKNYELQQVFIEAKKKAAIVAAAHDDIKEMVNMLKKAVERLLWEGPAGGRL